LGIQGQAATTTGATTVTGYQYSGVQQGSRVGTGATYTTTNYVAPATTTTYQTNYVATQPTATYTTGTYQTAGYVPQPATTTTTTYQTGYVTGGSGVRQGGYVTGGSGVRGASYISGANGKPSYETTTYY